MMTSPSATSSMKRTFGPPLRRTKAFGPPFRGCRFFSPPEMDDAPDIYAENPANGGRPSNTGAYAGAFSQDNPPLQGGAEPAFAEPAPPKISKREEPQEDVLPSTLDTDE